MRDFISGCILNLGAFLVALSLYLVMTSPPKILAGSIVLTAGTLPVPVLILGVAICLFGLYEWS